MEFWQQIHARSNVPVQVLPPRDIPVPTGSAGAQSNPPALVQGQQVQLPQGLPQVAANSPDEGNQNVGLASALNLAFQVDSSSSNYIDAEMAELIEHYLNYCLL